MEFSIEAILSAISTVGFPIVMVAACAWFIYVIWNKSQQDTQRMISEITAQHQSREEKLYEQLDKFSNVLINFNATLGSIDARLSIIEQHFFICEDKKIGQI